MNLLLQCLVYRFYAMPQTFCRGARGETPRLAHQAERLLVGDCITFAAASRPLGTHRTHPYFGSYFFFIGDDGAGAGGGLAGRWLPW